MSDSDNKEIPRFTGGDVRQLNRKVEYKGFYQLDSLNLTHRMFNGGWTGEVKRELFVRGESVAVLLYDVSCDTVVMIEQFRVGALEDECSPWLLECVAGMIETGEAPEEVAKREAIEEAGCSIEVLMSICKYWVSPGGTSERMHLYCGKVNSEGAGGIHGLDHENEDIRVHRVAFDNVVAMVNDGIINNAPTIMAIQWLQLNKQTVIDAWQT